MTKTVLVTGASGFLAAYVVKAFLDAGWNVRGTVRSSAKSRHILDRYPRDAKLELVEVADIVTGEGLAEALKGVDAVAHTASPYALSVSDPMKDFISPAVDGTMAVLRAAHAAGIKRVVVNFTKGGPWRDYTYTDKDWNPTTLEQACEEGKPGAFVYSASKKLAEKAALDFGSESGLEIPVNPPMIYGPPLQAMVSKKDINTSSAAIYALITGPADRPVPENRLPLFVSVSDCAEAHVRALEVPAAKGRYLLCGGAFTWEDAITYIAKERPELASRLPKLPEKPAERKTVATLDTTPAREVLGITKFKQWQEVLLGTLDALVAKEKEWDA